MKKKLVIFLLVISLLAVSNLEMINASEANNNLIEKISFQKAYTYDPETYDKVEEIKVELKITKLSKEQQEIVNMGANVKLSNNELTIKKGNDVFHAKLDGTQNRIIKDGKLINYLKLFGKSDNSDEIQISVFWQDDNIQDATAAGIIGSIDDTNRIYFRMGSYKMSDEKPQKNKLESKKNNENLIQTTVSEVPLDTGTSTTAHLEMVGPAKKPWNGYNWYLVDGGTSGVFLAGNPNNFPHVINGTEYMQGYITRVKYTLKSSESGVRIRPLKPDLGISGSFDVYVGFSYDGLGISIGYSGTKNSIIEGQTGVWDAATGYFDFVEYHWSEFYGGGAYYYTASITSGVSYNAQIRDI